MNKCVCAEGAYFNPVTNKCLICIPPMIWNPSKYICEACPANAHYDVVGKRCLVCPADHPYWNGTDCIGCPANTHFDVSQMKCLSCPGNLIFSAVSLRCNCP